MGCTTSTTSVREHTITGEDELNQYIVKRAAYKSSPAILDRLHKLVGAGASVNSRIALVFCNSYEQHHNFLGDPAINDALLTCTKLSALKYKCVVHHDTSPSVFLSELRKYISMPIELVVYYIGHGSRVRDVSGDEADGYDECFVFKQGSILDDTVGNLIKQYNRTKYLWLFADACHAGTIWDVPNNTKGITSMSSCLDAQSSSQYWFNRVGHGAFTYYLWNSIDKNGYDVSSNVSYINSRIRCFNQQCIIGGNTSVPMLLHAPRVRTVDTLADTLADTDGNTLVDTADDNTLMDAVGGDTLMKTGGNTLNIPDYPELY